MLYVLQLLRLRVLWKAWKSGLMILRELSAMLFDKLGECCRTEATPIDLPNEFEEVAGFVSQRLLMVCVWMARWGRVAAIHP